jgi:ABC-type branched-subunit amino acid transport system substrate-binding protein
LTALILVAAGCGNSGDDAATATTAAGATTTAAPDGTTADTTTDTTATGADDERNTFVPIEGVPGVTDDQIGYAVIGTRSNNPLGTCILDCYLAGINAYFEFRNDEGGIYGRQLAVTQELDDELGSNQQRALDVISANDVFGDFNATLLATGWADLQAAGVPTYVWAIHGAEANGNDHIFGSLPGLCEGCTGRGVPYLAQQAGATRGAALGYGDSENSVLCAQAIDRSFDTYQDVTGVEGVYLNDSLAFGLANGLGPEVTTMKDLGVDFIATCMDLNGMLTLAQELERQGMDDVVLSHPNSYNQQTVAEAGPLWEGDFVGVSFRPFEAEREGSGLDDFLQWMENTGQDPSELAMVGWINADEAFTSLLAAGPEFDRESAVAAMNQITDYSADGLLVPIDWTRQHVAPTEGDPSHDYAQECILPLQIHNGAFETLAPPDTPWLCWPNDSTELTDPVPTNFGG